MSHSRLISLINLFNDDPSDSFIQYAIAKEYENLGDFENALNHYLSLKESDPKYVGLYYHLGKLYEKLEEFEEAMKVYNAGVLVAREQGDTHSLSELNEAKINLDMNI